MSQVERIGGIKVTFTQLGSGRWHAQVGGYGSATADTLDEAKRLARAEVRKAKESDKALAAESERKRAERDKRGSHDAQSDGMGTCTATIHGAKCGKPVRLTRRGGWVHGQGRSIW